MKRFTFIITVLLVAQFAKGQNSPFTRMKAQLENTPFSVKIEGRENDRMEMYGRAFHVFTDELKLWYDGKTMWNLKDDEVYVNEPDETEFMPYQLFEPTKYGFKMEETDKSITFTKQDFNAIIWFDDDCLPERMEVTTPSARLDLKVKELRKCTFEPDHFKLDTKSLPNVEVVDLR